MDNEYDPLIGQLEEAFGRAVGALQRNAYVIDGVVKSVDYPDAWTCTVTVGEGDDAVDVAPVILRVLTNSQGAFVEIPKANSHCIILFRDGHQGRPQLLACHEADKILLTSTLIEANGGDNDGMVNIEPAISQWKAIIDDINKLKAAFNAWIVVPNDGGQALKTASLAWAGTDLDAPDRDKLEDKTFTH